MGADLWLCPLQVWTVFRTLAWTCLRGCGSPQPNQQLPGEKLRDPVQLQLQLDLLSSNRLQVELRLELWVAPNQSSKLESPKNYKIVFTEIRFFVVVFFFLLSTKTASLTFLSSWHWHQGGRVDYNQWNIWQAQNTNIFQISSCSLNQSSSCLQAERRHSAAPLPNLGGGGGDGGGGGGGGGHARR